MGVAVTSVSGERPFASMEYLSDAKRITQGISENVKGEHFDSSVFLCSRAAVRKTTQLCLQILVNKGNTLEVNRLVTDDSYLTYMRRGQFVWKAPELRKFTGARWWWRHNPYLEMFLL